MGTQEARQEKGGEEMSASKEDVAQAFKTIIDGLNSMSSDTEIREAMVEVLSKTHRTLQQNFMRVVICGVIHHFAELKEQGWFDLRNEGTVNICEELDEVLKTLIEKHGLPYV